MPPSPSPSPTAPMSWLAYSQVKRHIAEVEEGLARIKSQSPSEKHEAKKKIINEKLDAAWDRIFQLQDVSERLQKQREIQGYASELERLEITYEAGRTNARAEHNSRIDNLLKDGFRKISGSVHTVLGPSHCEGSRESASGDFWASEADHSQRTMPSTPAQQGEEDSYTSQPAKTHKRKGDADRDQEECQPSPKRIHRPELCQKSILFEDVFQDGHAPTKHVIVEWPARQNNWYIIRCEEHNMNFNNNPLKNGGSHMGLKSHGKRRDYNTVVENMGIKVLGCNSDLAKMNNDIALATPESSYDHTHTDCIEVNPEPIPPQSEEYEGEIGQTNTTQRSSESGLFLRSDQHEDFDPEYGQVYRVYRETTKQWLPAVLLPMENLEDINIHESMEDLGILDNLPSCYFYDTQRKSLSWVEGYEDGGPRVSMREFPVMFFNGSKFPVETPIAWVTTRDLQTYIIHEDDPIEDSRQISSYLEARAKITQAKTTRRNNSSKVGTRDTIDTSSSGQRAQTRDFHASSVSGNQGAIEHAQFDASVRSKVIPVIDLTETSEETSSEFDPETDADSLARLEQSNKPPCNGDVSLLQARPDKSCDGDDMTSTNELSKEEATASTTSPKDNIPQHARQQRLRTTQNASPDEPKLAKLAQMAQELVDKLPVGVGNAPTDQAYGREALSSPLRQQNPAFSQTPLSLRTHRPFTPTAGESQENAFQTNPNTNLQSKNPSRLTTQGLLQHSPSTHKLPGSHRPVPPTFPSQERHPRRTQSHHLSNGTFSSPPQPQLLHPRPDASQLQSPTIFSTPTLQQAGNDMWFESLPLNVADQLRHTVKAAGRPPKIVDFVNSGGRYACPFCEKTFIILGSFNDHLEQHCLGGSRGTDVTPVKHRGPRETQA